MAHSLVQQNQPARASEVLAVASQRLQTDGITRNKELVYSDPQFAEQLAALRSDVDERLVGNVDDLALRLLRAERLGLIGDVPAQIADYTGVIETLSKRPQNETGTELATLYGRRGDGYLDQKQWQQAADDFALEGLCAGSFLHQQQCKVAVNPRRKVAGGEINGKNDSADGSTRGNSGAETGEVFATRVFDSFDGMTTCIKTKQPCDRSQTPLLTFAVQPDARSTFGGGGSSRPGTYSGMSTATVEVRNTAATSLGPGFLWTARRSHPLLGQTLPERQVSDLLAAIKLMRRESKAQPLAVYGQGYTASMAIYAAILDLRSSEIVLADPPTTHEDPDTPEYLGVLRIGDLPHNLALICSEHEHLNWPNCEVLLCFQQPCRCCPESLKSRSRQPAIRRRASVRFIGFGDVSVQIHVLIDEALHLIL